MENSMITRIKSFTDVIAIWTGQAMVWAFSTTDLIEMVSLAKEIAGLLMFIAGLWYTIWKFRKEKKKSDGKDKKT